MLTDANARARVLNPTVCAAVTASAGSGKTESLALAYLARLAVVDRPEELLTLTYTRKACAELKQRVLAILSDARSDSEPRSDHEVLRRTIGSKALSRSAAQGWDLERQPDSLRFMTYDAFFQSLATMLPAASGVHESFKVTEDGQALYDEAVNRLMDGSGDTSTDLAMDYLWAHFDGSEERVRRLLVHMLAFREQWLAAVLGVQRREDLERLFADTLDAMLTERLASSARAVEDQWPFLLSVLEEQRDYFDPDSQIYLVADQALPLTGDIGSLADWKALANWVLTKDGKGRRTFNKHQGFPAKTQVTAAEHGDCTERKHSLLEWLQSDQSSDALAALADVQRLPEERLGADDLETLQALVKVLVMGAVQLQVVFQEQNRCDHIEYAMRALTALGHEDAPSELALRMDAALRHILCDEFQDTNAVQFAALARLVSGWEAGDGRTFIAVGDPKQSIYSFRKANPALFVKACEEGLGELALEPLVLETNFRSDKAVIDWVDAVFGDAFPAKADLQRGGVPHSPSSTVRENTERSGVRLLGVTGDTPEASRQNEARVLVEQIQSVINDNASASVAVLVKSRRAAGPLLEQFAAAGMQVKAIDMFPLASMDAVQDIVSLAKFIMEPSNLQYGFEWLRGRCVGMSLADLDALAETQKGDLAQAVAAANLTNDGQQRMARVVPIIGAMIRLRGRESVREITEKAWLTLGGSVYLSNEGERYAVEQVLGLISDLEADNELIVSTFDRRLAVRHGSSLPAEAANVEVMTVHRSKGQEYDFVFIPNAGAASRSSERPALLWEEHGRGVLMAPIPETGREQAEVYEHLYGNEKARTTYELVRQLYVAVTRARVQATLSLCCTEEQSMSYRPAANSLIGQAFNAIHAQTPVQWCEPENLVQSKTRERLRCAASWAMRWSDPARLAALPAEPVFAVSRDELMEGVGQRAERMTGKVGHTLMERVVKGQRDPQALADLGRRLMGQYGLGDRDLPPVIEAMVQKQATSVLVDEIVANRTHTEFRLTGEVNGNISERRIDLWYIDRGQGIIIDHKFTVPGGQETLETFGQRMAATYGAQMDTYRAGMSDLMPEVPWIGFLYFPALDLTVRASNGALISRLSKAA